MTKFKKIAAFAAIFAAGFISGEIHQKHEFIESHLIVESYTVQPGDTLWSVAKRYFDMDTRHMYILEYHDEIYANNPDLKKRHGQIRPGDVINLRYYKEQELIP